MSFLKLIVDDAFFYVNEKILLRQVNNLFQRVLLEDFKDDRIHFARSEKEIYVDADKDVFKYIVSYFRGYPLELNLSNAIRRKIHYDAKYFQITDLVSMFENDEINDDRDQQYGGYKENDDLLMHGMSDSSSSGTSAYSESSDLESYLKYKPNNVMHKETINKKENLLEKIQNKLRDNSDPNFLIQELSTDKDINSLLKDYNNKYIMDINRDDSDDDSTGELSSKNYVDI